jgi:hypothetical protein
VEAKQSDCQVYCCRLQHWQWHWQFCKKAGAHWQLRAGRQGQAPLTHHPMLNDICLNTEATLATATCMPAASKGVSAAWSHNISVISRVVHDGSCLWM